MGMNFYEGIEVVFGTLPASCEVCWERGEGGENEEEGEGVKEGQLRSDSLTPSIMRCLVAHI